MSEALSSGREWEVFLQEAFWMAILKSGTNDRELTVFVNPNEIPISLLGINDAKETENRRVISARSSQIDSRARSRRLESARSPRKIDVEVRIGTATSITEADKILSGTA